MDALAGLLDGPRARGAFLLRSILTPPWSLRIQDRAPLTLVAMLRGEAWVIPDSGETVRMHPGDVAIMRGPDPYTIADDPATPPHVVIHPGQHCTTLAGEPLAQEMDLGVRTWGNSPDGSTVMLTGTYQMHGEISRRLLAALPPLLVLPDDAWDCPLIPLLDEAIVRDDPGQEAVLDRLLDLLLIAVLRAWFSRPEAETPAWYRAHSDPVVGRALRMLHNNPAHPWTVAALADRTGVSRASLARRFTDMVGEPPMSFLTGWRLALAADLLRETDATIGAVARQVGYGSSFALSAAFKRTFGISPQEHRALKAQDIGEEESHPFVHVPVRGARWRERQNA
ncbi:AraC family transcriptional regulator [Streptosporangium sp. NPDC000396]|uniref:AraC family transcriptional regulator n=1 Tax=Streptosporangium sp. NPDC000396 TaxID=3366185 RepID=UPI00368E1281